MRRNINIITMENFGIDLNKVLDDFEESEDNHTAKNFPLRRDGDYNGDINSGTQAERLAINIPSTEPQIINNKTENDDEDNEFNEANKLPLNRVPGSGIFDFSDSIDLDKNVHRLEQLGNGETDENSVVHESEGHFIPDEITQDAGSPFGYDAPTYTTQGIGLDKNGFTNEDFYSEQDNDAEILQAASELEAHVGDREDRPSFMSSSPPLAEPYHSANLAGSSVESVENQSDSGVSSEQGDAVGNANVDSPIHRNECEHPATVKFKELRHDQGSNAVGCDSSQNTFQSNNFSMHLSPLINEQNIDSAPDNVKPNNNENIADIVDDSIHIIDGVESSDTYQTVVHNSGDLTPTSETQCSVETVSLPTPTNEVDSKTLIMPLSDCGDSTQITHDHSNDITDNNRGNYLSEANDATRVESTSLNTDLTTEESSCNNDNSAVQTIPSKESSGANVDGNVATCTLPIHTSRDSENTNYEVDFTLGDVDMLLVSAEAESELAELEKLIKTSEHSSITGETSAEAPIGSVHPNDYDSMEKTSMNSQPVTPVEILGKRRGSGESVERFLAPTILSPGIATPMDDPGFSKVPGFQAVLKSMHEEEEPAASVVKTEKSVVRPKEGTPEGVRKNRPNSLLGLSKPELPVFRPANDVNPAETEIPFISDNPIQGAMNKPTILSPDSDLSAELAQTSILRHKHSEPVTSASDANSHKENLTSSDTQPPTFPFLASVQAQSSTNRPASWPVNEPSGANQESQGSKNRRPNSLNLPPRGGSTSPLPISPDSLPIPSPRVEVPQQTSVEAQLPAEDAQEEVTAHAQLEPESVPEEPASAAGQTDQQRSSVLGPNSLITIPTITSPGRTPGTVLPPQSSSNPLFAITDLGKFAPTWVPDVEAPNCMQCEQRFTFTRRRHHCRACGKVFCSSCCNLKSKLTYLENKEARVCSKCYQDLIRATVFERMMAEEGVPAVEGSSAAPVPPPVGADAAAASAPNPHNPSEYCSTVPPPQQEQTGASQPPPTVMVPSGVLRKQGSIKRESRNVMFSDGVRPGGDLTEGVDVSGDIPQPPATTGRRARKVNKDSKSRSKTVSVTQSEITVNCYLRPNALPPVCMGESLDGELILEDTASSAEIMAQVNDCNPLQFAVNKNLIVLVKLVKMECCMNKTVWCWCSRGLCTVGQDEVVILLEVFPDEETLPADIFQHFQNLYEQAAHGNPVSHMDHSLFAGAFLDSRDHSGFLYVRPSFQCLNKLILPPKGVPFVFGLLLQKWEIPWAKMFPLRLLLRLGAEFKYYPCPLVSVRFRKPVFGEIGHTIMNLLIDFRNYQYMIPRVRGLTILMHDRKTFLNLPRSRERDVSRALMSSTEQVLALAAVFSKEADSYLVCLQNDEGSYQTQAINIHNKPRKVTGASFVVFNANLKSSGGLTAKSSIVEDGLMIQVLPETLMALRSSLREMRDYVIEYGTSGAGPEESVVIRWVDTEGDINNGLVSPIDKLPLDGVHNVHVHNGVDYIGENNKAIRWTQVFFLQMRGLDSGRDEPVDLTRLTDALSSALCTALAPKVTDLYQANYLRLGLRVTISNDDVGYEVGSNGEQLAPAYMSDLDTALIPVIHTAAAQRRDGPIVMELIFHLVNA